MNPWSTATLQLVYTQDYLDKLQQIYAHEEGERKITTATINSIKEAFADGDAEALLNQLLGLEKFPYKDSYVAFLRKDRTAIQRNPQTTSRIYHVLAKMGIEGVIAGIMSSKEANTRRGNQFGGWVAHNYPTADEETFTKSAKGIMLLEGGEEVGLRFCNNVLKLGITKRPDLVAKSGSRYVVGEAKFLSSLGGNQARAFDDGMKLATNGSGRAYKIFILDGIIWLEEGSTHYQDIDNSNATVLSAILLDDYLKSLDPFNVASFPLAHVS